MDKESLLRELQKKFDDFKNTDEQQKDEKKKIFDQVEELLRNNFKIQQSREPHPSKFSLSGQNVLEPENEDAIISIIKNALRNSKVVRVVGSSHSFSRVISDEDKDSGVLISLTKLRGVEIDDDKKIAIAWAGTNVGKDPANKDSTIENSLAYQLDQRGYALPETGGIIHQTVGGFVSTGSSGGSMIHSFDEAIIGIRLIDGTGEIHDLKISDKDNSKFLAAGVSMGLFGIITKVTIKLEKRFYITGSQTVSKINQNSPVDLFGDGDPSRGIPSVSDFFSNGYKYDAEYSRILWWPQNKVEIMSVWKAKLTYGIGLPEHHLTPLSGFEQFVARLALIFINVAEPHKDLGDVIAFLINQFNKIGTENFQDPWWKGLPMDNDVNYELIPVAFTELWIPFENTKSVINRLNELFHDNPKSIGNFFTEIYTTKKSRFWLSPAYEENVVRVDVNYFLGDICGTPEKFFQIYWDAFKEYKSRCHWGKYTPEDLGTRISTLYPKYQDWMNVRKEMDPNQIFVTPYWRSRLNIPKP